MNELDENLEKKKSSKKNTALLLGILVIGLILGISFAVVVRTLHGTKRYTIVSNNLQLYLDEEANLTETIEGNIQIPVSDFQGKETTGYKFSLINEGSAPADYTIYLEEDKANTMPIYALRYNLTEEKSKLDIMQNIEDLDVVEDSRKLHASTIRAKSTQNYELKIWLGVQAENDAKIRPTL